MSFVKLVLSECVKQMQLINKTSWLSKIIFIFWKPQNKNSWYLVVWWVEIFWWLSRIWNWWLPCYSVYLPEDSYFVAYYFALSTFTNYYWRELKFSMEVGNALARYNSTLATTVLRGRIILTIIGLSVKNISQTLLSLGKLSL